MDSQGSLEFGDYEERSYNSESRSEFKIVDDFLKIRMVIKMLWFELEVTGNE